MSGRQIGSAVGFVVGLYFGNPQAGMMIGGMIGGAVDPDQIQGNKIGDVPAQRSQPGGPQSVVLGTSLVSNCLVMSQGPDMIVKEKTDPGKGSGTEVVNEVLYRHYTIRICRSSRAEDNEVQGLVALYFDGNLVYDVRPDSKLSPADNAKFLKNWKFYYGGPDQGTDPTEESYLGVGNASAHRQICRIVGTKVNLTDYGNRIPSVEAVVSQCPVTPPNHLLVTGTPIEEGGPCFTTAQASSPLVFEGIPQSTGADIEGATAAYWPPTSTWAAVGDHEGRISKDNRKSWQPITVDRASYGVLVPGPAGWLMSSAQGPASDYDLTAKASPIEDGFSSYAFGATPGYVHGEESYNAGYTGGKYWLDVLARGFLVESESLGTSMQLIYARPGGNNSIASFHDRCKFGGGDAVYTACLFDIIAPRAQLRRSTDGGLSYPEILVDVPTGSPYFPMQLQEIVREDGSGVLLCYCQSGAYVWTSEDGFSEPHATGIAHSTAGALPYSPANGKGRLICAVEETETFYLISGENPEYPALGNKCVSTIDGITFSDPVPLGVKNAISISAASKFIPTGGGMVVPDAPGHYYDPVTGESLGPSQGVAQLCGTTLGNVQRWLCHRGQLDDDEIDVSQLEDIPVRGITFQTLGSCKAEIEPIRLSHFYDPADFDGALRFRLRGAEEVDMVIDSNALVVTEDEDEENRVIGQEVEYPKRHHLEYLSLDLDYIRTTVTDERTSIDPSVVGETQASINEVFSKDEANYIVAIQMKQQWMSREGGRKFGTGLEYIQLVAASLIEMDGRRGRIESYSIDLNEIWFDGVPYDRASAMRARRVTAPSVPGQPPASQVRGPMVSAVMNAPVMDDANDKAGIIWGGCGPMRGWRGGLLQMSRDGGGTWENGPTITGSAVMGELTAILPAASRYAQDNTNTLSIVLYRDDATLDSTNFEGLMTERNVFAIMYPNGTVEVMQFETAIETAPRQWQLTGLMRGRQDTVAGEHLSGAKFVLLTSAVRFVAIRPDDLGKTLKFRAVSNGTDPDAAEVQDVTFTTIESLREWQPYNLMVASDSSGGFCAECIVRARLGSSRSPFHSQWYDGLRWTFTVGSVVHTIDTSTNGVCVDAATMLEVFGEGYGAPQVTVRARSKVATNDDDFDSPPATPANPEAGELFAATGTFPQWYRGVYCILFNDDFDLDITGGYWDAGATGDVMPGVGVYAKVPLGSWFQATGFPTTAGAVTTDVTVYADSPVPGYGGNATITHGNTCLVTPTYSPVDLRFRSRFGNKLLAHADPGSAIQLVNGNPSFYSHGFTTGKRRAEFTIAGSTFAFWFGFNVGRSDDLTNGDNTIRVGYLMTDGAAAATTGDGTYWAEYDAATGAYAFGKVGGGSLGTGTVALPGGRLARFVISTDYAQNASIGCNFGIQSWIGTPSSGYGGVPYPISAIPVQWDVPAPSNAIMRLGDGLRGAYYGLRWSGTGYVMKGTVGKSSGQSQFAAAGGRVGICVASFVRSAGQLGDAGTADSVGWDGSTLRTCLSGVQSSIALPFLGAAIFALDADADELRVCRTNPDGTVAIAYVVALPAGLTWFPAVTDGGSPQLTYDPAGLPGYNKWTMTL